MVRAIPIILVLGGAVAIGIAVERGGKFPEVRRAPSPDLSEITHSYLTAAALPDSVALLAAPPAPGSEQMERDEKVRSEALALLGTPRYSLAIADADRNNTKTFQAFQCTFGTEISEKKTPHLYRLMGKVRVDVRKSVTLAQFHYKRPRPFIAHRTQPCSPANEAVVQSVGSYPSARGAVAWAHAFVLAELNPPAREAILNRAAEFSQSRVICDAAWQSDVDAGKIIGTEMFEQMMKSTAFQADLEAARREVSGIVRAGRSPPGACKLEQAALAAR